MTLLDYLVQENLINKKDIETIQTEAANSSLEEAVSKFGLAPEELLEAKGKFYKLPIRDIDDNGVPFDILKYIPEESATHYKFVPIDIAEGFLEVGVIDPDNIEANDALNFISTKIGMPFKIFLISEKDFKIVIDVYKGFSGEVTKALDELETDLSKEDIEINNQKEETINKKDAKSTGGTTFVEDAPVTKIAATILRYAVEGNASDIHIEAMHDKIRVRFRVDGVLNTSLVLPLKIHSSLVARIKVLCGMRLDEKRKPQDGGFHARIEGRAIDFRVSTFPAFYGEKVVMRILDQQRGVKKIDDMGISPKYVDMIKRAINKPYGLILISGPTGSGKTTTLYSMLGQVDKEENNVLSLEDPVEYNIDGMSQSQVRPEIGYTFATGLRTTLRQDPDVIMVGEIRDKETAQLAIQAALTGHLVFSTIHTNSATGIVPRLVDMGVDPYLIPPTLVLGMAQRLVRKLCPGAGQPIPVEGALKTLIDKNFDDLPEQYKKEIPWGKEVYNAAPTAECPNGTRGRQAVLEMFEMDSDIEKIILTNPVESEIYKAVRAKGMLTMREDAIIKAFQKEIPFEEVNTL